MKKITYLILTLLLFGAFLNAEAQMNRKKIKRNNKRISSFRGQRFDFKNKVYSSVGFSLSTLNYYGDLAPRPGRFSTDLSFTRPAFGLHFAHRFGPRYTLHGNFMYGTLRGADAESADKEDSNARSRYLRNLSFRNRIKELSVVASVDLWENQSTYLSRVKWTPYAFGGLAFFHHNPQAKVPATQLDGTPFGNAGEWVNLKKLGTEGQYASLPDGAANQGIKPYKLVQIAIPFGLGTRFRLNQLMDLSVEVGFRYVFTDYLDDVSRNYVDLGVFGDNELAKALSYRTGELPEVRDNPAMTLQLQSAVDGKSYTLVPGYGAEHPENVRGNKKDADTYMFTTFKLTYIIGKSFHRAKFR